MNEILIRRRRRRRRRRRFNWMDPQQRRLQPNVEMPAMIDEGSA